jgi:hypothetical protein
MTEYTSDVQTILYSTERVYAKLSDLNNLEKVQSLLPADKIKEFTFDSDSCSFKVDMIGKISLRVVDREPLKTIKLQSEESPMEFTCWIQLKEAAPEDTRLKLTLKIDLPFFLKAMVNSKIEEGIQKVAEALAALPY